MLARLEAEVAASRRRLALRWGGGDAVFDSLTLPEPDLSPPPPDDSVLVGLDRHAQVVEAAAQVRAAQARVRETRAQRIPDVDALFGVRRIEEAEATAFIAGLSIPLPVWNRQSGALAAAGAGDAGARLGLTASRRVLESEVRSVLASLRAAIAGYERLRGGAVPAAEEALTVLGADFRAGRLSYVDLADGHRAALETRLATIEAAADVWRSRAALARLVGDADRAMEEVGP
jgi:cobalt-zinc-cadmium efflux system outer membrane protein